MSEILLEVDFEISREILKGKKRALIVSETKKIKAGDMLVIVPKKLPDELVKVGKKVSLYQSEVVVLDVISKRVHKGYCVVSF